MQSLQIVPFVVYAAWRFSAAFSDVDVDDVDDSDSGAGDDASLKSDDGDSCISGDVDDDGDGNACITGDGDDGNDGDDDVGVDGALQFLT
jgi:hypothetical protein